MNSAGALNISIDDKWLKLPSSTRLYPLGFVYQAYDETASNKQLFKYMYVKAHDDLDVGEVYSISRQNTSGSEVITAAVSDNNIGFGQGVVLYAVESGQYCFVLIEGEATVSVNGTVAIGDYLKAVSGQSYLATNGTSGSTTNDSLSCGVAITAVSGGYATVYKWTTAFAVSAGVFTTLSVSSNATIGGVILASSGAVGSPAFSFEGDTNNGIYRYGVDAWACSVGGTIGLGFTTSLITSYKKFNVDDTTDATTTTDGSLQTDGGLSVAKSIVAGSKIRSTHATAPLLEVRNTTYGSNDAYDGYMTQNSGGHTVISGGISRGVSLYVGNEGISVMESTTVETVFNEGGVDRDFRVETSLSANGFVLDGGTGTATFAGAVNLGTGVVFPTSDPLVAGQWWDNAGTLTKSVG